MRRVRLRRFAGRALVLRYGRYALVREHHLEKAEQAVDMELRDRIRVSGMTSVSRAVSELVQAGLLKRHYQGYRVDHENRGAQRQAVYTVPPAVRMALGKLTLPL